VSGAGALAFARPEWALPLALAWLAVAAALALAWRRATRRRAWLLGRHAPPDAVRRGDRWLLLALAALGLALVGPRLGDRVVRLPASGLDLVVLIDVSLSMDARDVPPSRIARAREAARQALRALEPGDRAALAVFAGHGALLTPLTPDVNALLELVPAIDTELMTSQASQVGAGLRAALRAFDVASARPRVILLLADGEHADRAPEEVVREVARADVRIVAVAIGSDEGAPVPHRGGVLRDPVGFEVLSRRGVAALARFTRASGGALLEADRWGAVAPGALTRGVRAGVQPGADGSVERRVAVTRYGPLALLALTILLLEAAPLTRPHRAPPWLLRLVPQGARRRAGMRRAGLGALLALALGASGGGQPDADPLAELARLEAAVRAHPDDAAALLRLGHARATLGALDEAERAFFAAAARSREPRLTALAYYDLGVAALERGDLDAARDAFFDALAVDPSDTIAKFNLEWTLRMLDEEAAPVTLPSPDGEEGESDRPAPEPSQPPEGEPEETSPAPSEAGEGSEEPAAEAPSSAATEPMSLDPSEAERWLEQVQDDLGRALRDAAQRHVVPGREGGPRW
jgi:Ca-activated chloride channel homolog